LIRPSGIIRAKAVSHGVRLPPAGSFKEAVMRETLSREQNLQMSEVTLMVKLQQRQMVLLSELICMFGETPEVKFRERIHKIDAWIEDLLKVYEAELYQDRYTPAYDRSRRQEQREAEKQALDRVDSEARAAEKVARFSDG